MAILKAFTLQNNFSANALELEYKHLSMNFLFLLILELHCMDLDRTKDSF